MAVLDGCRCQRNAFLVGVGASWEIQWLVIAQSSRTLSEGMVLERVCWCNGSMDDGTVRGETKGQERTWFSMGGGWLRQDESGAFGQKHCPRYSPHQV